MKNLTNYIKIVEGKPSWLDLTAPQVINYHLIIGWDTEFQQIPNSLLVDPISYQYSAYYFPSNTYLEGIIYAREMSKEEREKGNNDIRTYQSISFSDFIQNIIDNLNLNIEYTEYKILLVAHYSLGEFSMISDREKLLSHLKEENGALYSPKPFIWEIVWKGQILKILVSWRDTYLLFLEDRSRSLSGISKVTSSEKIDLRIKKTVDKSSLRDTLLNINKELFELYSITDARIVIEYYCKFFSTLYNITGISEEIVGSENLSVKFFLKEFNSRLVEKKKREIKNYLLKEFLEISPDVSLKESQILLGKKNHWLLNNFSFKLPFSNINFFSEENTFYNIFLIDINFSSLYSWIVPILPSLKKTDFYKIKNFSWSEIEDMEVLNKDLLSLIFFRVNFKHPSKVFFPSLPVIDEKNRIIYPKEGISFCTIYDLLEAKKKGCIFYSIKGIFLDVDENSNGYKFSWFISLLLNKKEEDRGKFHNLLLDIMINFFYKKIHSGKFEEEIFKINKKKKNLNLIFPSYSLIILGLIRSFVSSVICNLSKIPGIEVLSLFNNKLRLSLPLSDDILTKFKTEGKLNIFDLKDLHPIIYESICNSPFIIFLINCRKKAGYFDSIPIDLKIFRKFPKVNLVVSLKKKNFKLLKFEVFRKDLTNFAYINKYRSDLVVKSERKKEIDFNWKRVLKKNNSTKPLRNLKEWNICQKKKKIINNLGLNTNWYLINKTKEEIIILTILELFISSYFQLWLNKNSSSSANIFIKLKIWEKEFFPEFKLITRSNFNMWKKKEVLFNVLPPVKSVKIIINSLLKNLDLLNDKNNIYNYLFFQK